MTKTMISARIPEKLSQELEALAVQTKRSKGFLLTEALENFVAREAWMAKKIDAAIAASDASTERFSQAAVEKWFLALGTESEIPRPAPDVFVAKRIK